MGNILNLFTLWHIKDILKNKQTQTKEVAMHAVIYFLLPMFKSINKAADILLNKTRKQR